MPALCPPALQPTSSSSSLSEEVSLLGTVCRHSSRKLLYNNFYWLLEKEPGGSFVPVSAAAPSIQCASKKCPIVYLQVFEVASVFTGKSLLGENRKQKVKKKNRLLQRQEDDALHRRPYGRQLWVDRKEPSWLLEGRDGDTELELEGQEVREGGMRWFLGRSMGHAG